MGEVGWSRSEVKPVGGSLEAFHSLQMSVEDPDAQTPAAAPSSAARTDPRTDRRRRRPLTPRGLRRPPRLPPPLLLRPPPLLLRLPHPQRRRPFRHHLPRESVQVLDQEVPFCGPAAWTGGEAPEGVCQQYPGAGRESRAPDARSVPPQKVLPIEIPAIPLSELKSLTNNSGQKL